MAYRVTDLAPVIVTTRSGRLEYHDAANNPKIEWLNGLQAAQYLRTGVVEHIREEEVAE